MASVHFRLHIFCKATHYGTFLMNVVAIKIISAKAPLFWQQKCWRCCLLGRGGRVGVGPADDLKGPEERLLVELENQLTPGNNFTKTF
jgi:hypothetical protein